MFGFFRRWRARARANTALRERLFGELSAAVCQPRTADPDIPVATSFNLGTWWKGWVDGLPFALHGEVRRGTYEGSLFVGPYDWDAGAHFRRRTPGGPFELVDQHIPPKPDLGVRTPELLQLLARLSPTMQSISFGAKAVANTRYGPATETDLVHDLKICAQLSVALAARRDPPLVVAVERGDLAETTRLLESGVPADSCGPLPHRFNSIDIAHWKLPLFLAAEAGRADLVERLLAAGADTRRGLWPLFMALHRRDARIVSLLATSVARNSDSYNLEWRQWTARWGEVRALDLSARLGDLASALALLDAGADPDPDRGFLATESPWRNATGPEKKAIRNAIEAARRRRRAADGRLTIAEGNVAAGALSDAAPEGALSSAKKS